MSERAVVGVAGVDLPALVDEPRAPGLERLADLLGLRNAGVAAAVELAHYAHGDDGAALALLLVDDDLDAL